MSGKIDSEEKARKRLIEWFRQHGYEGNVRISVSYGRKHGSERGDYYDFDVLKPYGVYMVYADGTVEDNYGNFSK